MPAKELRGIQAVILIGGEGTRLRPFTLDLPKPLLPIVNRPFLSYQLEQLRAAGVRDVILCTAYRPASFKRAFGDGRKWGLRIRYIHEKKPLGTGGAVRNARPYLDGPALVFNGDVFNDMDLGAFFRSHTAKRADASIALVPVRDPTQYGLVETGPDGSVRRFLEKPTPEEATTDTINAGAYIFEPRVLERIPAGVPYSLERGLFPGLLSNGSSLLGFVRTGYWLDIGTVEKYLQAHKDILEGRAPYSPPGKRSGECWLEAGAALEPGARVEGRAALGKGARVKKGAILRGSVCLGPGCLVGEGALVEDSVLLEKAKVGAQAKVARSVLGRGASVGAYSVLAGAALAEGSRA